jgi:pimeloyl-ACP methyl ester carboxylesterase
MTMTARRRRVHKRLAALPGVRAVRRPVSPGAGTEFDLYYVRTGPVSAHPVVILTGGPGVASVLQYKGFRRRAAAAGLDVLMVEHRGVGMSRHDDTGADLPPQALTVDQVIGDVAAALDDAHVDTAVIYGTSYGSYIAAGLGVRHPERVHAMILDSPLLCRHDMAAVRDALGGLLWDGDGDTPDAAALPAKTRKLVAAGIMDPAGAQVAATLYGYGGAALLERQLDLLLGNRKAVWRMLGAVDRMVARTVPFRFEMDLVSRIAFRELDYAGEPDGSALDPAVAMRERALTAVPFEAEPYDLNAEMPNFGWPTVVISGGRDLITPGAVAERIVSLIPGAALVRLPTMAHSALDSREAAALEIAAAVCSGQLRQLAADWSRLDALPERPVLRLLSTTIGAALAAEKALPALLMPRRRLPNQSRVKPISE